MKDLPVHPAAAVFPMLPDDELQQLADDIKHNGLQVPIVVGMHDTKKHLIDGRNRLAACKMAGVDPEYRELNGQDATAFILSANINRRHMTKGQRAMAVAMLYPEPEKGGRGKKSVKNTEFVSSGYVAHARLVLDHAPDLASAVMSGSKPLNEAYETAKQREKEASAYEPRLEKVRAKRVDLADMVVEERLTLEAAELTIRQNDENEKAQRQATIEVLYKAHALDALFCSKEVRGNVSQILSEHPDDYSKYAQTSVAETVKVLKRLHAGLESWLKEWK